MGLWDTVAAYLQDDPLRHCEVDVETESPGINRYRNLDYHASIRPDADVDAEELEAMYEAVKERGPGSFLEEDWAADLSCFGTHAVRFDFDEESVDASDRYWEQAVEGELGGNGFPAAVLRGRREQYPDEMAEGYGWKKRWRITSPVDVGEMGGGTSLGWDFKITPDGDPVLLEFGVGQGTSGFGKAFQYGRINGERRYSGSHDPLSFRKFLQEHGVDKRKTHEALDRYMADLLKGIHSRPGEPVVVKPSRGSGGHGVEIVGAETEPDQEMVERADMIEEFVPSKDIMRGGEAYEGSMRYVNNVTFEENGLLVTDLGGYWRTSSVPKDADAPARERFVVNLGRDGEAATASFEELGKTSALATRATRDMYVQWLEHRDEAVDPDEVRIEEL